MTTHFKKPLVTKFLHACSVSAMRLADSPFFFVPATLLATFGGVALLTDPNSYMYKTDIFFGGSIGSIVVFFGVVGIRLGLGHIFEKLSVKGQAPGIITQLSPVAHYSSQVFNLAKKVNEEIHSVAPSDIVDYKNKVKAQFFILRKNLPLQDSTELKLAGTPNITLGLLEENTGTGVEFLFSKRLTTHYINSSTTLDRLGTVFSNYDNKRSFSEYLIEEVAQQKLSLLDLAYDAYEVGAFASPKQASTKEDFEKYLAIPCLLMEAVLNTNSTLNTRQTKELVEVLGMMGNVNASWTILKRILTHTKGANQLDLQVVAEYIQSQKTLSVADTKSMLAQIKSIQPDFVAPIRATATHTQVKDNVDSKSVDPTIEPHSVSTPDTVVEPMFPAAFTQSLSQKSLSEYFKQFPEQNSNTPANNLDNQPLEAGSDNGGALGQFKSNLSAIKDKIDLLDKNNQLIEMQQKIELKVLCMNSIPHILSYGPFLKLLQPEQYSATLSILASTTGTLLAKLEEVEQTLGNHMFKEIQVLGQQFENKKSLKTMKASR